MSKTVRILSVLLLGLTTQLSAATIDYTAINAILKSVADKVVAEEQVKDKDGKDLIDRMEVVFDEKATDLSKGKVKFTGGVYLHGAIWAPKATSSLNVNLNTSLSNADTLLTATAGIGLKTDLPALIRYGVTEAKKSGGDPCGPGASNYGSDVLEEAFITAACTEYAKLATVKSTGEFLDLIQTVLAKRLDYVEARLVALEAGNDTSRKEELKREKPYLVLALNPLKARTPANRDAVTFSFKDPIEVVGSTEITAFNLDLTADSITVRITVTSPEGAGVFVSNQKDLEELAETLSLSDADDKDDKKVKLSANFKSALRDFVQISKSFVLPK